MRFLFLGPIRRSLILLVLLAVLPSLAILLYSGSELRHRVVNDAEDYSLRQVKSMAAHHERVVENARLLLVALAKSSEIRNLDVFATQTILSDILASNGAYVSLTLADVQGNILVTVPEKSNVQLKQSPFFQQNKKSTAFVVGEYFLLPGKHRVAVQFGQPVLGAAGQVMGVLVAEFDVGYFGGIFYDLHLPDQSVFTLTDMKGVRLTRFPETEKYTWVADLPQMVALMSGKHEEGTFLESGVDGVSRLYGFKRIFLQGTSSYLMIRLGIPVDQALAEARSVTMRNVALLVLAAILALAMAWCVAEFTMLRRLSALILATSRLKQGNLAVRTGMSADEGELGALGVAFDSMAEGLEEKEEARTIAEEKLHRLNEELEERVAQRTGELAKTNLDLQQTLVDLQRTQKHLVMSEKLAALGELVAGVAHEVNTPVGVALSAGSTLAEKSRALNELYDQGEMKRSDLAKYLSDVKEGGDMVVMNLSRASELIRSFKMVAADQVSENKRLFNVKSYINEILLSLRPKLKKTQHHVVVECVDDLMVESYPGAFSQILTNFIINSLVHGFAAEQAGEIRIEVERSEGTLKVTYKDTGVGMPPEVRDRIFEPFFTTARSQGSTGLGLHIVFNIVTRTLQGTLECESSVGQGTAFIVTMPV
ncbi:MAG: ATP-binding protein [Desulfobulbus sp.]|nr:ATP-binding protein [Desulfobulbus sp.]